MAFLALLHLNKESCQLHISVNRTAQIYLELHFCVELHTKKALLMAIYIFYATFLILHGIINSNL